MQAKDILTTKGADIVTISPEATLSDAIGTLAARNIGAVLVLNAERDVVGILSERDVVRVLDGAPTGYRETKVSAVMTTHVFTADLNSSIDDLLDMMTEKRIRHIPIMDAGQLAGVLSIGDVVKHRIREAVGEAEALKDYIAAG